MEQKRFIAPTTELTVLYKMSAGESIYQLRFPISEPIETSGVDFEKNSDFIGRAVALFTAKTVRNAAALYADPEVSRDFDPPFQVHSDHVKGYRIVAIYGQRPKALIERWDDPIVLT